MTENNDVSNEEKITRDLVDDLKSQISRLSSMKEKGSLKGSVDSELCSTVLPIILDLAEAVSTVTTITIDNAESIADIQEEDDETAGGLSEEDSSLFSTVFERFRFFLDQSLASELPEEVKTAVKENLELVKKAQARLEEINVEDEETEEEKATESEESSGDSTDTNDA